MPISVIDSTGLASPLTGLNNPTVVGNMTFNTSGSGVIFTNTTSGVLTNSTLNDYETGTWTPTDASGAGLTLTNNYAHYTKIGNIVTVIAYITWPSNSSGSSAQIGGLPFSGVSNGYATGVVSTNVSAAISALIRYQPTGTTAYINPIAGNGTNITNANLSTSYIIFSMTYQTNF